MSQQGTSPPTGADQGGVAGSSQSRVEILRQKLEQYNAGIAKAMSNLATQAAASSSPPGAGQGTYRNGGGAPLVPPSLSGVRPLAANRPVERELASEFLSQSRSMPAPPVEGNWMDGSDSAMSSQNTSQQLPQSADTSAQGGMGRNGEQGGKFVYDVEDSDDDEFEDARSKSDSEDAPPPPPPPRTASGISPKPNAPVYEFNDLETAYHRVNAVQDCAKVLLSFPSVVLTPMQDDRARLLLEAREQLLVRDRAIREERDALLAHRSSVLRNAEDDVQSVLQNLLTETTEARRCFSPVYERKAMLYAKEKQLEQLGHELQRLHQVVQTRRSNVATIEGRVEQRRRALKRRDDMFQQTIAAHSSREEELRRRVEQVEELNKKVASWIKILENRETALTSKEQRLKGVQSELQHRVANLHR
jgi:hypothetical protein